ncbi:MAG: class GN sortase [Gammaproteobacteria bacterium]|nr:class GN sortase [Gammaproteobacteria bacterium]
MKIYLKRYARSLSTVVIVILFSTSLWQLATAGWIQGKALIAQQLLMHSWERTLKHENEDNKQEIYKPTIYKPWPWADTWPVAKLIVPQHDIEQIILAGDNGSSLAFGPGYSLASASPNTQGLTLISAHRDTHFKFIKDLKINEMIYLQSADKTIPYQIYGFEIVDSKTYNLAPSPGKQTLVLATCYPFDAVFQGGSLRYLVYASVADIQHAES